MKAGAILKIQKVIIKNAPTILAVMGGVTTIIAVCMSSEASLKAHEAIKEAEEEAKGDDYELYSECKEFWAAILVQGLEQTIIEYGVKITNLQTYYKNWNKGIMTGEQVYESDLFFELEYFIIFFAFITLFSHNEHSVPNSPTIIIALLPCFAQTWWWSI